MFVKTGTSPGALYYIHKDHLGSITALTNTSRTIVEEYAYDPWGRRRNPADWSFTNVPVPSLIHRGFTGHEHIDEMNLINMNGRIYDPLLGRLLSPDINVSYPDNTQNFNRYSYALNNPLKFTDPDGNNPILALIIWGAYFGGAQANTNGQNVWKGMLVGAASGAAGGIAGGAAAAAIGTGGFLGGAVSGFAGGFVGGFVNGAGNSWLSGQSFGQGLSAGTKSGLFDGLISGGIGGMVGGYGSLSENGTFWDGKYKMGQLTASTGDDIVNGGTLPEVTVHGTAGMDAVKGRFGFGYSINAGFGIGSRGTQISLVFFGEPHQMGQLFISVGHPNYNTRVPQYLDCSISSQIMVGGTSEGRINLSGPGRSWGAGYELVSGGYSSDLQGNLKIVQFGASVGAKWSLGHVYTNTKTIPCPWPKLWNAVGFNF